jgi:hypothetical protein
MSADLRDTQDDLAFVRSIIDQAPKTQSSAGQLFLVGGLAYGAQCAGYGLQAAFSLNFSTATHLALSIGPTIIFLAFMCVIIWRDRKKGPVGVATRAMNAAWGSTGLVNMAIIVVFAFNALREKSWVVWFLYPVVVCALQGGVWYVAYMIRRKTWLAAVSAGWLFSAVALGFMTRNIALYCLTIGLALIFCMALPGWIMMRQAAREQA